MNLTRAALTLALAAVAFPASAHATDYYVSKLPASALPTLPANAKVFYTIQDAINYEGLSPGDNINVLNGTYTAVAAGLPGSNTVVNMYKSGTPGYPISIKNYPGQSPKIALLGNPATWDGVLITGSYVNFEGFEVVGDAQIETFDSATSKSTQAILAWQAGQQETPKVEVRPSDALANSSCVEIKQATHVLIAHNIVHDCSASGIAAQASDYISIKMNVVYNTSWWTSFDTSGINIHNSLNSDQSTDYKMIITNNISHDNANTQPYYKTWSLNSVPTDGNGIIVDVNQTPNPYVGRTLIMSNIVYNNGGSGSHCWSSAHVDYINNTAFNNNQCPPAEALAKSNCGNMNEGQIFPNNSRDVNLINNIMLAPTGKIVFPSHPLAPEGNSENHNLFFSVGGAVLGSFVPDATDVVADPLFESILDIENESESMGDAAYIEAAFSLQAKSPARNVGAESLPLTGFHANHMNGNLDTGIDLGALSFVAP